MIGVCCWYRVFACITGALLFHLGQTKVRVFTIRKGSFLGMEFFLVFALSFLFVLYLFMPWGPIGRCCFMLA